MKRKVYCLLIFFLLVLAATTAQAVIFASDCLYMYDGDKRIRDNSVIFQENESRLNVCEKGEYWISQRPEKRKFKLFITGNPEIMTNKSFYKSSMSSDSNYEKYLMKKIKNALYPIEFTLPESMDRKVYESPPPGMTGGRIGSTRYFKIDIKTGKLQKINSQKN